MQPAEPSPSNPSVPRSFRLAIYDIMKTVEGALTLNASADVMEGNPNMKELSERVKMHAGGRT